ncbi:MAG TPA: hypothetical protein ENK67_05360 [Flavobacteriia bacterium]|jgi:hypothetical protein|nr:hypothetical protein [Flavobacteriia bacterium]
MNQKTELANILRAELTLLTKDILQNIHQKDISDLYNATRQLYEKMAAIQVLSEQLKPEELKELLQPVKTDKNTLVEETPNTEIPDQKKPNTVKDDPYKKVNNLNFVPKEETQKTRSASTPHQSKKQVQPKLKKINIGLNDRIAFIKHLFDNDQETYKTFIDQLNAFESYEDALRFINQDIKPQYNNWDGKDEYEFRLLQLLELKFA